MTLFTSVDNSSLNRTSVGLKLRELAWGVEEVEEASIEPAWD